MNFAGESQSLLITDSLDASLEELPQTAAVFVLHAHEGVPYIGRTGMLRRRLKRLLRAPSGPSRLLNLRSVAVRVDYWLVASQLESMLVLWDAARTFAPESYLDLLKLRYPPFVKLVLGNEFPRLQVTTRLAGTTGQFYGPFRSRGAAEEFEHRCLDLFQLRRCQEDLEPNAQHPGCMYGEMSMCLRPCQQVVTREEYGSEALRVSEFLRTAGRHMLRVAEDQRERMSADLDFEAAAREHKRIEKIQSMFKLGDELATDLEHLHGVAITKSTQPHVVNLWFLASAAWQSPIRFSVALADQSVSMDRRVKDIVASLRPAPLSMRDRQEHLAMLTRWFYSSWRDGEWVSIPNLAAAPYRRIISGISRTVQM